MSTAVLSVTGVASAATTTYTFSTDPAATGVNESAATQIEIDGDCSIAWVIDGAAGGASDSGDGTVAGSPGSRVTGTTTTADGDVYKLFPGRKGGDASMADEAVGTGGTTSSGIADAAGDDGVETLNAGDPTLVDVYGGGGGSGSVVVLGANPVAGAKGGDGAGSPGTGGGVNSSAGTASALTGGGVISGTVTCTTADPVVVAPGTPTLVDYVAVGDGTAKFQFTPGVNGDAHPVNFEYQLDGGVWKPFTPGMTGSDDLTGTLTGLTNLQTYSLSVRATSASGTSAGSAPVTFQPYSPVAAPASVAAKVGVTALTVSWTPPADASGIVAYEAFAIPAGAQSDADLVVCTTANATATSCTIAVKAGVAYEYGVHGIDAGDNLGEGTYGENPTAVVPASAVSATLPKADGTLTTNDADGKVVAGEKITITGKDFLPGSTVELVVYSTPVKLGEATVLSDGTFSATVTLPADLTNGVHHLVATGVDVNGNVRNLVVEVTVSGGVAALALTGFSPLPFIGAGVLALGLGGGLLVAARRRAA
ncbi:fibronectin type III domain-containing protein [Modestobacter versicolor]|uniref:fibronectin type III domain-containing protein n=1 Tax=Modestobacter versicolor TaxID=429133 RepID=UPI0034DEB670